MKSAYGQAAGVVLSVLELSAPVGQSDPQGEQLHSGLVAPWIAEFEGVHRARYTHCPAEMSHRHEQALLYCPPVQQVSYLADVPQVEVRPAAQGVHVTPHAECLIQLSSNVPHH